LVTEKEVLIKANSSEQIYFYAFAPRQRLILVRVEPGSGVTERREIASHVGKSM
jgi:hypothetical protein